MIISFISIWYFVFVMFWVKYGFPQFANHCILNQVPDFSGVGVVYKLICLPPMNSLAVYRSLAWSFFWAQINCGLCCWLWLWSLLYFNVLCYLSALRVHAICSLTSIKRNRLAKVKSLLVTLTLSLFYLTLTLCFIFIIHWKQDQH